MGGYKIIVKLPNCLIVMSDWHYIYLGLKIVLVNLKILRYFKNTIYGFK